MILQASAFSLPPLPYLLPLLVAAAAVGAGLWRRQPAVTEHLVGALVPWMLAGAALRTLPQVRAVPEAVAPLLGILSVYLTSFAVVGGIWLAVDRLFDPEDPRGEWVLAGTGTVALFAAVAVAIVRGPAFDPAWSVVAVLASVALAAAVWAGLRRAIDGAAETVPLTGPLLVFGHALDGVSTAVGVDVLGFGERTPASRVVLEVGAALPTADLIGSGWLFVLVKLLLVAAVLWLTVDYVREDPTWGRLLVTVAAAVGLGPGAHNVLLYAIAPA